MVEWLNGEFGIAVILKEKGKKRSSTVPALIRF